MRTIIHDLDKEKLSKFNFDMEDYIVNANECKNSCIGCFSCWIKHSKYCFYKDNFSKLVDKLKNSDELIIISKSRYGCYSTNIKRVLERCLGYVLPYFEVRNNMIHHKLRYKNNLEINTFFYGVASKEDQDNLYSLVKANCINLGVINFNVNCFNEIEEITNACFD